MKLSESVLNYVATRVVGPARSKGDSEVAISAGQIHRDLKWISRVPSVCAALNSTKLQRAAGLELIEKSGPPSGQSTTMVFRYRILDSVAIPTAEQVQRPSLLSLLDLYGICKGMYDQDGGAEAFIRAQREDFGSIVPDVDPESALEEKSTR